MASNRPAFVLSIIGGALMLLSGIVMMYLVLFGYWNFDQGFDHMGMMGPIGFMSTMMGIASFIGLVSGAGVIVAAMMAERGSNPEGMGIVIIVLSVIGFLGMGGFVIGSVLGLVGGILYLNTKRAPGPA